MNPVYYLIAILLAIDSVFIRFRFMGMSYDRWLLFLLFLFYFRSYIKELDCNPYFKKWNAFLFAFGILQFIINLKVAILGNLDFEIVYTDLVKCLSFVAFSYLFLMVAKKGTKYINIILVIHFLICVFAFLLHPASPIASSMLEIKKFLFSSVSEGNVIGKLQLEETYITGGFSERFRLSGPFSSTINFSYFALSSFFISFYMYLRYKRRFYFILLITLTVAAILTQTRSFILAIIFLIFGYLFFKPGAKSNLYKVSLIIFAFLSIITISIGKEFLIPANSRIIQLNSAGQEDTRPYLWLTAVVAVVEHPFGITFSEYNEVRNEMASIYGKSYIKYLMPHNGLINIGFHYSIIGYLLFFLLLLFLVRHINLLNPDLRVFFKLTLISYLIHSSFHNSFVLSTDYHYLMVLMLINIAYQHSYSNNIE